MFITTSTVRMQCLIFSQDVAEDEEDNNLDPEDYVKRSKKGIGGRKGQRCDNCSSSPLRRETRGRTTQCIKHLTRPSAVDRTRGEVCRRVWRPFNDAELSGRWRHCRGDADSVDDVADDE